MKHLLVQVFDCSLSYEDEGDFFIYESPDDTVIRPRWAQGGDPVPGWIQFIDDQGIGGLDDDNQYAIIHTALDEILGRPLTASYDCATTQVKSPTPVSNWGWAHVTGEGNN